MRLLVAYTKCFGTFRRRLFLLFVLMVLTSTSETQASLLSAQDQTFFEDAALATLSEIQFGQIAQRKATDRQVRDFASRNVSDYSRLQETLSGVATADQAELPQHLSGEALRDYRRLVVAPRPWFDRLYVYMMFKWHAVALRGYQEAAKTVTEPELRTWAQQSLPIIEQHLESIRSIAIAKGISTNSGDNQHTIPKY
jgi:putative membrane protein